MKKIDVAFKWGEGQKALDVSVCVLEKNWTPAVGV